MNPYNRINITIKKSETEWLIQLSGMARFGRDFAPWDQGRYFVASNGFILASEHESVRCYPRIGKLSLPAKDWVPEYAVASDIIEVYVDRDAPVIDTYFDSMIVALREYETAARVHDELNK